MSRRRQETPTTTGPFDGLRADYRAAKSSRFRRVRTGVRSLGSNADYHYRTETDYLKILEQARDFDRNDSIIGRVVDVAKLNTIQDGFRVNPQTGDDNLDGELKARWLEWADDQELADIAGEKTFAEFEEHALRAMLVDGDVFINPTVDGALEMVEAHRCRTPKGTTRNVVHGILLDSNRKRQEYWFTKADVDPSKPVTRVGDMSRYPARDDEGHPAVFHIVDPKRSSQTRGVTAFAPVFDCAGMFEDLNFAKLIQAQVASCIAILRERNSDFKIGSTSQYGPSTNEVVDGLTRLVEEISPGMEVAGLPGEKLTGFSPNVPNPEYFQHAKLILTLVGINLGVPLVMLLMDASETNFSGWRGAVDQARMGFRRNQALLKRRFHARAWQWKVRQWMSEDGGLRRAAAALDLVRQRDRTAPSIFRHTWSAPRWPYIQPLQDAQADAMRIAKRLTSPRRLHAERGQDYDEILAETVQDNQAAITAALRARDVIASEYPDQDIDWHELLYLPSTKDLTGLLGIGQQQTETTNAIE